jgi:hypothetical protein
LVAPGARRGIRRLTLLPFDLTLCWSVEERPTENTLRCFYQAKVGPAAEALVQRRQVDPATFRRDHPPQQPTEGMTFTAIQLGDHDPALGL